MNNQKRKMDFSFHLLCITNQMLDAFIADDHCIYVKTAKLYVEKIRSYGEGSVEQWLSKVSDQMAKCCMLFKSQMNLYLE